MANETIPSSREEQLATWAGVGVNPGAQIIASLSASLNHGVQAPALPTRLQLQLAAGQTGTSTLTLFLHTSPAADREPGPNGRNASVHVRIVVSFSNHEDGSRNNPDSGALPVRQDLAALYASLQHEQQLFVLGVHRPVQAAQAWYRDLLNRLFAVNHDVEIALGMARAWIILATLLACFGVGSLLGGRSSQDSAHYVVCERYLQWKLFQLDNAANPRLAVLRERERRVRLILHSLTSIDLSAEGIHLRTEHLLRKLRVVIQGEVPPVSWTTRLDRMLMDYEETGRNLAAQVAQLVEIVLGTMMVWEPDM